VVPPGQREIEVAEQPPSGGKSPGCYVNLFDGYRGDLFGALDTRVDGRQELLRPYRFGLFADFCAQDE
jgi:hypothetical protein